MASMKHFFVKPKYIYPQPEPDMSETDENVFEFDESDIHNLGDHQLPNSFEAKRSISISRLRRKPAKVGDSAGSTNRKTSKTGSLPVNIPDWSKILQGEYRSHVIPDYDSDEDDEDDEDINDGDMVTTGGRRMIPPHEYLARRRGSSFSLHEGIGGTAKGRDLRRLRNAIWEKIGFQDYLRISQVIHDLLPRFTPTIQPSPTTSLSTMIYKPNFTFSNLSDRIVFFQSVIYWNNMPIESIPISELTPATGVCKVKFKIVRLWGFPKKDKPNELSSIDLLLLDTQGDRIQANIKPNLVSRFEDKIHEDGCFELMNFELSPNVGQFRGCSHPYKINFIFYTVIKPCENLPNTENVFKFCPFPEIISRRNDDSVFVDIIGEIIAMNEIKEVSTADGKSKLLNLQLRDLGDSTLDIALWGKIGESVYSDVKSQQSGPVVFLGSLMKTMKYNGKGTAQSSKFSTKVFINHSQPDIIKFKEVLCKGGLENALAILPVQESFSVQHTKKSFALADLKTISEIYAVTQDISCNILATIVSIETATSWYFTGCSICFKTVTPYFNAKTEEVELDKFSCAKCDKQITTTQTRFKLKFQVMDHTGSLSLIAFDDVVIPLIKKSVYQLLEEQVQFNRKGQTPPELLDLNGRQFVFKIMVANSDQYNKSSHYRVLSLTDAPDVIQSFSDSVKTLPGVEHVMNTSCGATPETTTKKDAESQQITDSGSSLGATIQSCIMSSEVDNLDTSAADFNTPTPTSKRSLRNSKDDPVQQSSTKPRLVYTVKKEKK